MDWARVFLQIRILYSPKIGLASVAERNVVEDSTEVTFLSFLNAPSILERNLASFAEMLVVLPTFHERILHMCIVPIL